jgi:4-amino-4-deoxy-L-arabinose transferase-like glycosyltransferase
MFCNKEIRDGQSVPYLFFLLLFLLGVIINIWTLKDGHNWGDDFAQYIIQAQNIIEGKPYAQGVMLDNPTSSQPGFPLLISPLIKLFGLNFKILKSLNIFFWYLSIILLYPVFRKVGGRRFAVSVSLLLAFSSFIFLFKQNILTDIPFFFFICLSLYFSEKNENKNFALFLLAMSASLWIRSAGAILFVAAFLYFIIVKRKINHAFLILLVLILNVTVLFWIGGINLGTLGQISQNPIQLLMSAAANFATVFRAVFYVICPEVPVFPLVSKTIDVMLIWGSFLIYSAMIWFVGRALWNRSLSFIAFFSFLYLTLAILWSGVTMPHQWFSRYTLPLLPFFFISSFYMVSKYRLKLLARMIFLFVLLFNILNIGLNWTFNDDNIKQSDNAEMLSWIKNNVHSNERFMFWKPRAVALMTKRVGTAPWLSWNQTENFISRADNLGISYIILLKLQDQELVNLLESGSVFSMIWENKTYKVFKRAGDAG